MQKRIIRIISFMMIMLLTSGKAPIVEASKTTDNYGNSVINTQDSVRHNSSSIKVGNSIYYALNEDAHDGIYKIDKSGTKIKLLLEKSGSFHGFSRYKTWLYFIWDKDGSPCSLTSNSWICKMKLDGTGFKKICRSNQCMIWNNMLYYQKTKYDYYDGEQIKTDIDCGKICSINLKTGKKHTFKGKKMFLRAVEKNRIYYYKSTKGKNVWYVMNKKGQNRKKIGTGEPWEEVIYNSCRYYISGKKLYKASTKNGKKKKICTIKGIQKIMDIKSGNIYVLAGNYPKLNLYSVSLKNGKKTCILKSVSSSCKVYNNIIIGENYLADYYYDKNGELYNCEAFSYNLKTKKRVRLTTFCSQ